MEIFERLDYRHLLHPGSHRETVKAGNSVTPFKQFIRWLDFLPPQFCR